MVTSLLQVEDRGKEKREVVRKRWTSIMLLVLSLAAAIWLLLMGTQSLGKILFSDNEQFLIQQLILESDGPQATPKRLKEWAKVDENMNIFDVDIAGIQHDLESRVPVIKQATVIRELPDTLVIRVQERQALARLGKGRHGMPLAIDEEGYVLGPSSRRKKMPEIVGYRSAGLRPGSFIDTTDMRDALDVLTTCDTTHLGKLLNIQRIGLGHPDYLDLRLQTGVRVKLAPNDIKERLQKVAHILHTCKKEGLTPLVINATGKNNYPVQYQ